VEDCANFFHLELVDWLIAWQDLGEMALIHNFILNRNRQSKPYRVKRSLVRNYWLGVCLE